VGGANLKIIIVLGCTKCYRFVHIFEVFYHTACHHW